MRIAEMTAAIRAGDEATFTVFYDAYAPRMLRYLLVAARGDELAAQEVQQDALLRALRYMKVLTTDDELWRYLAMCMRSSWLDRQRARRTAQSRSRPLPPGLADPAAAGTGDEDATTDQMHALLAASLASLPDEDRRLVEAHYFAGHSQVDLAAAAAIPVKTLAMRLVRLRRRIRALILEGLGHGGT